MAGVEEMDLGVGHVAAVGLRLGGQEGRVVAAPRHQQRRPVRAQPLLRDRAAADVAQPGGGGREEVLAQRRLVGRAVRPERPAGVPQRAQAVGVRDRVLHDHRPDPGRVRGRQPEADRAAVVLHEQGVPAQAELLGEAPDDLGQVIEGVGEAGRAGRVAVAETRVVRRDEVELVGQPGQQRLPHPRRGREAVEQQDSGPVGRARLAVEDRHPVDVGRLVDRVAHRPVLAFGRSACSAARVMLRTMPPNTIPWNGEMDRQYAWPARPRGWKMARWL